MMVVITGAACDVTGGSKYLVSRNMLSSLLVVQVENHWVQRFAALVGWGSQLRFLVTFFVSWASSLFLLL